MFRYFWFIFSADLQFRRAIEQPNVINTDGLGINPSPKLNTNTILKHTVSLLYLSDEQLTASQRLR